MKKDNPFKTQEKLDNVVEEIGQLAETLDNALFGYKNMRTLPPQIHLDGLSGTIEEVRDMLAKLYKENGGEEELNLQA